MSEQYVYCWYHHMMPRDQQHRIEDTIMHHNWEAFQLARGIYDSMDYKKLCPGFKEPETVVYFPDHIFYYPDGSSEFQSIELTEETFNKITSEDCECG